MRHYQVEWKILTEDHNLISLLLNWNPKLPAGNIKRCLPGRQHFGLSHTSRVKTGKRKHWQLLPDESNEQ